MDPELFELLFSIVGIGWLSIAPTYRGWKDLNSIIFNRIEKSKELAKETSLLKFDKFPSD